MLNKVLPNLFLHESLFVHWINNEMHPDDKYQEMSLENVSAWNVHALCALRQC